MKTLLFALLLTTPTSQASKTCNQQVYDKIYREVIHGTLRKHVVDYNEMERRNYAIRTMRSLCFGQLSTYEIKSKIGEYKKEEKSDETGN